MTPDPRWLEILKASGWQTLALAVGCGTFLYLARAKYLPPVPDVGLLLVWFAFLICSMLFLASFISGALRLLAIREFVLDFFQQRAERKALLEYIPQMRQVERDICAFLIDRNWRTFDGETDGGHASTLMAFGFVRLVGQNGQRINPRHCPFEVPRHLWTVLVKNRAWIQTRLDTKNPNTPHPWRRNWLG
jgi:hypothetical protein